MRYAQLTRISVCLLVSVLLTACTYHGRIRRGLYTPDHSLQKADRSLLVISDKNIPKQVFITDPSNTAFYGFTLDVADGTAVAVTDALSAFVSRADAGVHTLENQYDFAIDVKLACELTRSNCAGNMQQLSARQNGLCTQLTLTIRPAGQSTPLATLSGQRWDAFDKPGAAVVVRWTNQHTLYLLSPVLLPTYTQLQGAQLRHQFETHLKEILDEMTEQLRERPELFTSANVSTH